MGLENSGKSSLILNLSGYDNIMDYYSLTPTIGDKANKLRKGDSDFILWEIGGQEKYINEYLKKLDKFLLETEEIFFLIDIQDVNKYERALDYLNKIVKKIIELKNVLEITIFLHKYDHDILKYPQINNTIIENLITSIKEIIPSNFYYEIYKTTLYMTLDKEHVY